MSMPNSGSVTPNGRGVQELLHGLPVALRREPGDQADEQRDADPEQPQPRDDHGAVAGDRVLGARHRHEDRAEPVGDPQRERDRPADQHRAEQELQDAGEDDRGEDAAVADLAEPQPVDVEGDQAGPAQQQQHEDARGDEQDPGTAVQRRGSHRGPHGHGTRSSVRGTSRAGCLTLRRRAGASAHPAVPTLRTVCGVPVGRAEDGQMGGSPVSRTRVPHRRRAPPAGRPHRPAPATRTSCRPSGAVAAASAQFSSGTRNTVAPASRAARILNGMPPMGETSPVASIAPVPATNRPPVSSPGESLSTTASANIRPAEGPPMSPRLIRMSPARGSTVGRTPSRPWARSGLAASATFAVCSCPSRR